MRPFTPRELKMQSELCVTMTGNTTILKGEDGKERTFAFDHCFWSHDGFTEKSDGFLEPTGDRYADQNLVFDKVGREILDNAWDGYHCCLFAYGQTGSGKSYSIVGYGANKGVVPRCADAIFERIDSQRGKDHVFEVTVSMMEIYNEKVHDLLVPLASQKEVAFLHADRSEDQREQGFRRLRGRPEQMASSVLRRDRGQNRARYPQQDHRRDGSQFDVFKSPHDHLNRTPTGGQVYGENSGQTLGGLSGRLGRK